MSALSQKTGEERGREKRKKRKKQEKKLNGESHVQQLRYTDTRF
jgi:hypothetical protein